MKFDFRLSFFYPLPALEGLLEGTTSAATMETDLDDTLPSLSASSAHQLASGGRADSHQQPLLTMADDEYSSAVAGKGTNS